MNRCLIFICLLLVLFFQTVSNKAFAYTCCTSCDCEECALDVELCDQTCSECSKAQQPGTESHFTEEMKNHRIWLVERFWLDSEPGTEPGLLAAMQLMTSQLTANAMAQVTTIGAFFDAKHQLETQRLFQTLTARAHKDYHPSEGLCNVATASRSLSSSERKSDLISTSLSKRSINRQLLTKDGTGMIDGVATDQKSRLIHFIKRYCNPHDNANDLGLLCQRATTLPQNRNRDINYTSTLDNRLTLNIDPLDPALTDDEQDLFALTANLIAHEAMPKVAPDLLLSKEAGVPSYESVALAYLNSRSLVAKRSVAGNSLAAIAALKAKGDPESQPFLYALLEEMGLDTSAAITEIGEQPSYHAQMEILTKKIYQRPLFFSQLYDKPANVLRKDVAIQAAELMQKRDIYRSLLRSEAVLAVMLETALLEEQEKITNELNAAKESGNRAQNL